MARYSRKISIRSHSARKGLPASPQRISGIARKPESVPEKILGPEPFLALLLSGVKILSTSIFCSSPDIVMLTQVRLKSNLSSFKPSAFMRICLN